MLNSLRVPATITACMLALSIAMLLAAVLV